MLKRNCFHFSVNIWYLVEAAICPESTRANWLLFCLIGLRYVLTNCPNLRYLQIQGILGISAKFLEDTKTGFPHVEVDYFQKQHARRNRGRKSDYSAPSFWQFQKLIGVTNCKSHELFFFFWSVCFCLYSTHLYRHFALTPKYGIQVHILETWLCFFYLKLNF